MISERLLTLVPEPGVTLAARVAVPAAPAGGLVVCHPHPLYGGDMDNPVVMRLVEAAGALDFATLRFNFRGVGGSTGVHGGGVAEQADLRAALSHLRAAVPAPLVAAGYSFGAVVAAHVAADAATAGLVLVAPPLGIAEYPVPAAPDAVPVLVVAGDRDEYCPPEALDRLRAEWPRAEVTVLPDADHFFFGRLFPLGEVVAGWLGRLRAGQSGRRRRAG